jgi:hypothetical protein
MAFLGDTLYVADLDTVRTFDRKTGAAKKSIPIAGALFLNDLAAGSDSRLRQRHRGQGGLQARRHRRHQRGARRRHVKPIIRSNDLGGPNGLATRAASCGPSPSSATSSTG